MASSRLHIKHREKLEKIQKTLPDYVQEFFQVKSIEELSPSTLYNYAIDYIHFFKWMIQENLTNAVEIKQIELTDLASLPLDKTLFYFDRVAKEKIEVSSVETKEREKTSVNRKKSALRALFKYLTTNTEDKETGEPYFHRNVMLKVPVNKPKETLRSRSKNLEGKIFTEGEDILFLDFIKSNYINEISDRQKSYFKRDFERDFAILSLFLGSGIRINELAELRLRDLNFKRNLISVIRKGNKKDTVYVVPASMEDLKTYLKVRSQRYNAADNENEYVFVNKYKGAPSPLSYRAIQDLVVKYTKAFNQKMSPHKLRHTFGTLLMEETNDPMHVMEQLGHSSMSSTALYVHTTEQKAKRAAQNMSDRRKNLSASAIDKDN